jgi:hypothetical protein
MAKVTSQHNLSVANPKLAQEWNPAKNGALTPDKVTPRSSKKVWWKCPKGEDHEWQAIVANRSKGIGCPICSNHKVTRSNSLGTVNPKLAKDWHPSKNGTLTPYNVLPSANIKVWWKCPKGDDHEWQAKLNNRANGKGCPVCSGHKVVQSNSLATRYPEIAKQWHPTKNGQITPKDVSAGAIKKVWWKCPKGDDHEWLATINHRTGGTGCPKCNPAWSIPELRIFCELRSIFPAIQHRAILKGHEVDIYIPEVNVGIEYDGVYWHQDKHKKDQVKNGGLASSIILIRVREEGLPVLSTNDIRIRKNGISISTIKIILRTILSQRNIKSQEIIAKIYAYLKTGEWLASEQFNNLYSERKLVAFEKTLSYLFPNIAKEWHPTKNDLLLPEHFTPGSGRKIWWFGKCGHEWQDSINHRTSDRDCPMCRYKKVSQTWKRKKISPNQLDLF